MFRIFGQLENEIMDIIWRQKKTTVREVLSKISQKRKLAYTTVMTIMNRLVKKGLLSRELSSQGVYIYYPKRDRKDFLSMSSRMIINDFVKNFGELAIVQFIDALDKVSPIKFKRLKNKYNKKKD